MSIKLEMEKDAKEVMELMEKNTGKLLQEAICDDIKQEINASANMRLQNEEILEDNSILLTISLD